MWHPEEGTIHAWLDGALPEAEARRVAEHVEGGCAQCAAAAREARGLIAGASRIVGALDGGVPARAGGTSAPRGWGRRYGWGAAWGTAWGALAATIVVIVVSLK